MALRGLKIDDELEPGRLLDRHVGGLGASQQRDKLPCYHVSIELDDARPIAEEPALLRHFRPLIDSGRRNDATRSRMIVRLLKSMADASTLSAPASEALAASIAGAISSGRSIRWTTSSTPCARAASCSACSRADVVITRTASAAMRRSPGAAS